MAHGTACCMKVCEAINFLLGGETLYEEAFALAKTASCSLVLDYLIIMQKIHRIQNVIVIVNYEYIMS